jgi:HK97 family phage prohead protease
MTVLSSKDRNNLDDSDFAYIDAEGNRHLPIPDEAHVKAALSRFGQTQFDNAADKKATATKLLAAAKKFGVDVSDDTDVVDAAGRAASDNTKTCPTCKGKGTILDGHRDCPPPPDGCGGKGTVPVEQKSATPLRKKIPMSRMSTRSYTLSDTQVRMSEDGNTAHFSGYASTANEPYHVEDFMGSYNETMRSGCFKRTLGSGNTIPLLVNHDGIPIASTGGGTMTLSEDKRGLKVDANLDRRQSLANDVCIALDRGDLTKMSFSFVAEQQEWNADRSERGVTEARLFDVSIVTMPANPATTAALRAGMVAAIEPADNARLVEATRDQIEARKSINLASTLIETITKVENREGKTISAATAELLQTALDALHTADDKLSAVEPILVEVNSALDEGQKAISDSLGTTDPDGDPADTGFEAKGTKDTTGVKGSAQGLTPGSGAADASMPNQPDGAGPRSAYAPRLAETKAKLELLRRS